MELKEYRAFTQELRDRLDADHRVIGLIAVGSMAEQDTKPDRWSDHDFWIVVSSEAQEFFRTNLYWLPDSSNIAFSFRETEHGVKVLYRSSHLVEFAVFDIENLHLAKINRFRILIDKGDIHRHLKQIVKASHEWSRSETPEDSYLLGQLITNVLVAAGRWRRGEKLSGRAFLQSAAKHLAILLAKHSHAGGIATLDSLDPLRRFEFAFPELGMEMDNAFEQIVPSAGTALLEIAERELKPRIPQFPEQAFAAVRRALLISLDL